MDGHPLFVAPGLLIKSQTMEYPHDTCKQENTVNQQEDIRNPEICIKCYFLYVFVVNSSVDPPPSINHVIEHDEDTTNIANFLRKFSYLDVLFLRLVISSKHFSHFKISVGKQKMPNVVETVGKTITKFSSYQAVFIEFLWVSWALRVILWEMLTVVPPLI